MSGAQATVTSKDRDIFYAAAVAGLRALDRRERTARRFGPDADTRWASFKGALDDSDRIDFLLRDAAVTWGVAFSPADAFGLFGLAPDEPFGPDWRSLGNASARRYLDGGPPAASPADLGEILEVAQGPELFRDFVAGEAHGLGVAVDITKATDDLRTWTPPAAPKKKTLDPDELYAALVRWTPEVDEDADEDDDAEPPEGPTVEELASEVGVIPSLVNKALKVLLKDGRAEKLDGRPARYVATGDDA